MGTVRLGSFYGTSIANANMVKQFRDIEHSKHPKQTFSNLKKIAIEAPAETIFIINDDVEIKMPSTGIFEIGYGLMEISSLVFNDAVEVNIVYMY